LHQREWLHHFPTWSCDHVAFKGTKISHFVLSRSGILQSISDAAKEIKFAYQILLSMGIKVKLPIIVQVDNIGAIFKTENVSTSSQTKHVDVKYHFVHEYVEDGFIKIIFVRSEHNVSDRFTKNVTGDIYDAHNADYMAEQEAIFK
jgi:hypothetical protein